MLREGNNSIELILCGNPQPKLFYTFQGESREAKMIRKLDDSKKMYKYKIFLENVDRRDCGSIITFNANGFGHWQANSTILVKCKNQESFLLFSTSI